MSEISISIVLYKNDSTIKEAVESALNSKLVSKLYLVDNSPTDVLKVLQNNPKIHYIHNPSNLGYGAAHNIAINLSIQRQQRYHVVMNPDIHIIPGTLEAILEYMEQNLDVGQIMPKIFYRTGEIQRLCKLLPTPIDLIGRRFLQSFKWFRKKNQSYELHNFDYNSILNTPCMSGCFMFFRTDTLKKAGLFDTRFFMYLEDYDLTRRVHAISKTLFFPYGAVIHGYQKESYRDLSLLKAHLESAVRYFNKWGWFYDSQRALFNNNVLQNVISINNSKLAKDTVINRSV